MPGVARALRAITLAGCLAAAAAGCAASPASHAPPSPSASPSAAGSTAASADPRTQILGAYTGMWHAYAIAARTADYQSGALSQYAAGDALMILTRSLYDDHQHGMVLRGTPAFAPRVTSMTPAASPDSSWVTDCADDSQWRQYTTSGQPASGAPAGRHRVYAQLRLFGSAWKVTTLVVEKAGTCSSGH